MMKWRDIPKARSGDAEGAVIKRPSDTGSVRQTQEQSIKPKDRSEL